MDIVEGIIEWTEQLEALGTEAEQEFMLLYRDARVHPPDPRLEGATGARRARRS